jgi:hypothetical protein
VTKLPVTPFYQIADSYTLHIDAIRKEIAQTSYRFIKNEHFVNELFRSKGKVGSEIVWIEILYRSHYCAVTALLRTDSWLNALILSKGAANFSLFAASMRALIESCADIMYTFDAIGPTLAGNLEDIYACIHKAVATSTEGVAAILENKLLHFAFAQKPRKNEDAQHIAKQTKEYFDHVSLLFKESNLDFEEPLLDLYSELCDLTHPGALSINRFLKDSDLDSTSYQLDYVIGEDRFMIYSYEKRYEALLSCLLTGAVNSCLYVLIILHAFDIECLRTETVLLPSSHNVPGLEQAEQLLAKFRKSHQKA